MILLGMIQIRGAI